MNDVIHLTKELLFLSDTLPSVVFHVAEGHLIHALKEVIIPRERLRSVTNIQPAPQPTAPVEDEIISGLYLFGPVIDRTRRTVSTRNDFSVEIVTYTIQDTNGRRYYVDEYSPEEYYDIDENIELPVYVKILKKLTGDIGYSFCVQQQVSPSRGEHF